MGRKFWEQSLENWNEGHRKKRRGYSKRAWDPRKSFSDDWWTKKPVSQTQLTHNASFNPFPMAAPGTVPTAIPFQVVMFPPAPAYTFHLGAYIWSLHPTPTSSPPMWVVMLLYYACISESTLFSGESFYYYLLSPYLSTKTLHVSVQLILTTL